MTDPITTLRKHISVDPEVRGGEPCLRGSRIPVAMLFAELLNDWDIDDVADELGVDKARLKVMYEAVVAAMEKLLSDAFEAERLRRVAGYTE